MLRYGAAAMRTLSQNLPCVALLLVLLLSVSGCGGATAGSSVAQVGESTLSRSALEHWLAVAKDVGRGHADRRVVLSKLIGLEWIAAEARELGVRANDAEAGRRLELLGYARTGGLSLGLGPRETELQRLLASSKLTAADRLWLAKLQILAARVQQRLVMQAEATVGHAQLIDYYRGHESAFVIPERRDVAVFMVHDQAIALRGMREIRAGKPFAYVARQMNVAPEADGGLIMGLVHGSGEPNFEAHIFGAKLNVMLGPVLQALYYVFKVTRAIPPTLRGLRQVEAEIRRRLATQAVAGSLLPNLQRRLRARTACHEGYALSECGR